MGFKKILLLVCLIPMYSFGQDGLADLNKIVKFGKIESSDGASYIYENDSFGNLLYSRNVNMNGPITMIYVVDHDSLGRQTMSYSVHSNLGYSVYEKEYSGNHVFDYSYSSLEDDKTPYDQKSLEHIKSKEDFMSLANIQNLKRGKRRLTRITSLTSNGDELDELSISESGDTSSINRTEYDSLGRRTLFQYGVAETGTWSWDIYFEYDDSSNMIYSYRISRPNEQADTSEVHYYSYDKTNRIVSNSYYYKGIFRNKTEYVYSTKKNHVEYFYEGDEDKILVMTSYEYDDFGHLKTKTQWDYRNSEKNQMTSTTYSRVYW